MQEWRFEAPEGFMIQLTFEAFDIELNSRCSFDYVEIHYEGFAEQFCGNDIPG